MVRFWSLFRQSSGPRLIKTWRPLAALSRFCRERLAAYKCLTQIRVMPELPKTETGKITRNTLKQIFATANDR